MSRNTKEMEGYLMAKIRQVTLRDPTMSHREVVEALKSTRWGEAPIVMSVGFVKKIRDKITRQRMHNVNSSVIARINEMKERAVEVQKLLWKEALTAEKSGERTLALREITKIDNQILQTEINASIYERNLGTLKGVEDRRILVANIINETDENSRQQFIHALKANLDGSGSEVARVQVRPPLLERARDLPAPRDGEPQDVEVGGITSRVE